MGKMVLGIGGKICAAYGMRFWYVSHHRNVWYPAMYEQVGYEQALGLRLRMKQIRRRSWLREPPGRVPKWIVEDEVFQRGTTTT